MSVSDYERRDRIERVADATSSENDLVTLAIPPESSIQEVRRLIEERHAEEQYVEEQSRQHVRDALERVRRTLREFEEIPEEGLAIYAGVIDGELVDYVFDDLPESIPELTYEHANEFDTGPLEAATTPAEEYGLIVVETDEAILGRFVDERVETVETVRGQVPGKTRAGGQSDRRFERERERQKDEFFERVAEEAERAFVDEPPEDATDESSAGVVDALLVGGTEITADEFLDSDHLDYRLRDRVAGGTFAVEYASERGLEELVERAEEHLLDPEERSSREALDRFFERLGAEDDQGEPVVYGRDAFEEALTYDAVETAFVAEDLPVEEISEIEERVNEIGGDCVVVSTDFERGERFHESFGGVAAVLRFPIE